MPKEFRLLQNYPNPFNPDTWIPFALANEAEVVIRIYNLKEQLIRTLNIGHKQAGFYMTKDKAAYWNGRDNLGQKASSGLYFYTIQARPVSNDIAQIETFVSFKPLFGAFSF